MTLPELNITVYSDYICPFCYVGHHRLQRLRDSYELKINWCFLEIHPETSVTGDAIESLDYPSEQWQKMLDYLQRMAKEEDIPLAKLTFITNSKDALLLSEAAKQCGRETFYQLHEKLFSAYFVDSKNIADRDILRELAESCGLDRQSNPHGPMKNTSGDCWITSTLHANTTFRACPALFSVSESLPVLSLNRSFVKQRKMCCL